MPSWVQVISSLSPLTHAAEAVRSVVSRGLIFIIKSYYSDINIGNIRIKVYTIALYNLQTSGVAQSKGSFFNE